jgi:cytochrome c-type biogenesis protein CcmH/NrfF
MVTSGKSESEILQHYVALEGGMHVLSEPPNDGVGKLSWLVPYAVGMSGLLLAAAAAVRWSRRAHESTVDTTIAEDGALSSRLDDELRDLD